MALYRRSAAFDHEVLEDDLILMNPESLAVVVLNAAGQVVWTALEAGATVDDLVGMFGEAFPGTAPDTLRRDIADILDRLLTAGLASRHGDATGAP